MFALEFYSEGLPLTIVGENVLELAANFIYACLYTVAAFTPALPRCLNGSNGHSGENNGDLHCRAEYGGRRKSKSEMSRIITDFV
jgi:hypothetical protein